MKNFKDIYRAIFPIQNFLMIFLDFIVLKNILQLFYLRLFTLLYVIVDIFTQENT